MNTSFQAFESPEIVKINWGSIHINMDGQLSIFRDVKLFPGGAKEWNWKITGTSYNSGILRDDIVDLVEAGTEVVILSKGFYGRLKVSENVLAYLKQLKVDYFILNTEDAIRQYNRLRRKYAVGALIHTTC